MLLVRTPAREQGTWILSCVRVGHRSNPLSSGMVVSSTILDGLQTAAQVACKFEFDSLRQRLVRRRSRLSRLLSAYRAEADLRVRNLPRYASWFARHRILRSNLV